MGKGLIGKSHRDDTLSPPESETRIPDVGSRHQTVQASMLATAAISDLRDHTYTFSAAGESPGCTRRMAKVARAAQ